jgi:hypothetical protein
MWKHNKNPSGRPRDVMAAVAGAVATALLSVVPAAAADRHLSLEFEAYVGGISALTVDVDAGLRPDAYNVDFRFGTRGIVSWILDWKMSAYSRGALADDRLMPASATTDSLWSGDKRMTRLDYGKDGSVSVAQVPPPDGDDRNPVPDALKRGTVDISSALLGTLEAVGRTGSCDRRVKVYDGRRRYDLVFENAGKAMLGPDTESVYHGEALVCRLWIDPKAGFRKLRSRMDWATGDYAKIYVAKVFAEGPPVPVALEYGTTLGQLRAYLTDARFSDGALHQRLARDAAKNDAGDRSGAGAKEDEARASGTLP